MSDGVENEMTPVSEAKRDRAKTETRDAVEAAIDMTKGTILFPQKKGSCLGNASKERAYLRIFWEPPFFCPAMTATRLRVN